MIYAIPCINNAVSNHFSRCQQIAIFDSITQQIQYLSISRNESCGSAKKKWQQVIAGYKVDIVVVRNIGQNMLKGLFQSKVKVLATKAKQDVYDINFAELIEVDSLDYGRVSPKKKACGHNNASPSLAQPQPNWRSIRRIRR
ncbi:NifB/NifX family molybdenum-iron cluster-binding protein [Vibrio bivalvicida]|uniref:NifB/NifX family molybdenum-iron cluster-binding protein n=1 Tax=Vibrio bivalvicida TaxID=1276888 RepID=A0ABV4MP75_9VIBR